MQASTSPPPPIPMIALQNPDRSQTVQALRQACQNVGFFYLHDHGVNTTLLRRVMEESKKLFALSLEEKQALTDPVLGRGYTAMQEETLDPQNQTQGDTKEGYYIGKEIPPEDPRYDPKKLRGPNQWPSSTVCRNFRPVMEEYYQTMCDLGLSVVRFLAVALDLPEHYFDSAFMEDPAGPMASIRLLHYASVDSIPDRGIFACGAHSDYGMITLLLTDDNPGLQVLTKDQEWVDVPPIPNAFVVNLGDMLERWTNGLFRSTKHRVLTTANGTERYSIPFFYEPSFDTVVECLEICKRVDPNGRARYPPTTSGQHLLDKYKQTHADFQPDGK